MVANVPWQKEGTRRLTPAEDRFAMVEAAVADVPGLVPGRLEIDHGGNSYTADTLEALGDRVSRCRAVHDRRRRCGGRAAHVGPIRRGGGQVAAGRGRPSGRARGAARRRRLDPRRGPTSAGVEHRSSGPILRRPTAGLPRHRAGARRDPEPLVVPGAPVTAIAAKRKRTHHSFGFIGIVVLVVAAAADVRRRRRHAVELGGGEAVGVDLRPIDGAAGHAERAARGRRRRRCTRVAGRDDPASRTASVAASWPCRSNADATAAFGDAATPARRGVRRRCGRPRGFTAAVQEMLSITIERSQAVTVAELRRSFPEPTVRTWRPSPPRPPRRRRRRPIPTRPTRHDRPGHDRSRHDRPGHDRSRLDRSGDRPATRIRRNRTPVIRMPTSRSPPSSTWGQSRRAWASSGQRSPPMHRWPSRCGAGRRVRPAVPPATVARTRRAVDGRRGPVPRAGHPRPGRSREPDRRRRRHRRPARRQPRVRPGVAGARLDAEHRPSLRIVGPFSDEQIDASDGEYESTSELMLDVIGEMLFFQANVVSVDTAAGSGRRWRGDADRGGRGAVHRGHGGDRSDRVRRVRRSCWRRR